MYSECSIEQKLEILSKIFLTANDVKLFFGISKAKAYNIINDIKPSGNLPIRVSVYVKDFIKYFNIDKNQLEKDNKKVTSASLPT